MMTSGRQEAGWRPFLRALGDWSWLETILIRLLKAADSLCGLPGDGAFELAGGVDSESQELAADDLKVLLDDFWGLALS